MGYKPNGENEDTCQQVTYEYDNPHNDGTSANPIGRLTGMSWSGGPGCIYTFQEEYAYEAGGTVWKRVFTMTNQSLPFAPITLTSIFHYDAEGRLTVSQYPAGTSGSPTATSTYTTEHDALGRQSDLYVGSPFQYYLVQPNNATYNAAGQLTAMSTNAYTETRQYNANLQLTQLIATPTYGQGVDFTYTYPTTGNNGRISQMTDNITPHDQVNYTYDVLNRLVQAASSVTGTMTFAYDGFGNLTQQGQTYLSIDPTTNRINSASYYYNANGNVTQTPNPATSYAYDVANRLVSNNAIYNPRNQRVFDGTSIYLYTPDGKLAGKYTPVWNPYGSQAFIQGQPNVYFAGKLIQEQGQWVMTDRLGSVRVKAGVETSSYQPYGTEVTQTSDQRTKFATYYRDSAGLDYAGERYYSNVAGGFFTPDPGGMAANPMEPGSWNRYAYVQGDPVNFNDSAGLFLHAPDDAPPVFTVTGVATAGDDICFLFPYRSGCYLGRDSGGSVSSWTALVEWDNLSEDCQHGLRTKFGGTASIQSMVAGVNRAAAAESTLEAATAGTSIDWSMLAAIGIMESGFNRNLLQSDGSGAGAFQIDSGPGSQHPEISQAQALNFVWAANWAAKILASNQAYLATTFDFDAAHLLQATAASWNLGRGGISGNPNTIDKGSKPNSNYGSTIVNLMDCFD